jgi:hypothetical protein
MPFVGFLAMKHQSAVLVMAIQRKRLSLRIGNRCGAVDTTIQRIRRPLRYWNITTFGPTIAVQHAADLAEVVVGCAF